VLLTFGEKRKRRRKIILENGDKKKVFDLLQISELRSKPLRMLAPLYI
jgi:hypothetical protein